MSHLHLDVKGKKVMTMQRFTILIIFVAVASFTLVSGLMLTPEQKQANARASVEREARSVKERVQVEKTLKALHDDDAIRKKRSADPISRAADYYSYLQFDYCRKQVLGCTQAWMYEKMKEEFGLQIAMPYRP